MKILNQTANNIDLYVYGEIVDEKWWESDVDASDFRDAFDAMEAGDTLNIYMNSGGGSVFTAVAICAIIDRLKAKGVAVNGFIDGLSASACTFIAMACDKLTAYKSSMMMIHKPMAFAYGNASELQKTIDTLNQIEESTMMPLYEAKAKVDVSEIKEMIDAETWLSADEMSEVFDIEIVDASEKMVAMDRSMLSNYANVPEMLKNETEEVETSEVEASETETVENTQEEETATVISDEEAIEASDEVTEPEPIDYSEFENRIRKVKGF